MSSRQSSNLKTGRNNRGANGPVSSLVVQERADLKEGPGIDQIITTREPRHPVSKKTATSLKKYHFEKHWTKDWAELANFFVSVGYEISRSGDKKLQTRVIHYEGEKEDKLDGVATTQLVEWMLNQANPPLTPACSSETQLSVASTSPQSVEEDAVRFELSDLDVSVSKKPSLSENEEPSPGELRMEVRLSQPAIMGGEPVLDPLYYIVDFHIVDMSNNQWTKVATQPGLLERNNPSSEIKQDFPFPTIGRYQSYVSVRLLPSGNIAAWAQGPIIRLET